jgi:hypothetical protein
MKMINPPRREKRVYRANFFIAYLEVSERVALRGSLLAASKGKQIVFQRDVPGVPLRRGECGEIVNGGGKWDLEFPEIFSLSDKNWHRMRCAVVFRGHPRSS